MIISEVKMLYILPRISCIFLKKKEYYIQYKKEKSVDVTKKLKVNSKITKSRYPNNNLKRNNFLEELGLLLLASIGIA